MGGEFSDGSVQVLLAFADARKFRLSELPSTCNLSAEAAIAAVEELVDAGIVVPDGSFFEIKFSPRSALRGLERGLVELTDESLAENTDTLRARASLFEMLTVGDDPANAKVLKLTDDDEILRNLQELAVLTKRELLSLHAGSAPPDRVLASSFNADADMVARGVHLRIVFPVAVLAEERMRAYTQRMEEMGTEIRFADALPHRLIVSDSVRAVVPVNRTDLAYGALWTSESALVAGLNHLATVLFRRGRSLADIDSAAAASAKPTFDELRMLTMMSSGVTDEVAARRLSISERTFRRHMSSLLERLDATSRFQAGIRAVERGWL